MTGTLPPTKSSPRVTSAGKRPAAKLSKVVLPQPEGPTTDTNSPTPTLSETSSTATTPAALNSTETCEKRMDPGPGAWSAAVRVAPLSTPVRSSAVRIAALQIRLRRLGPDQFVGVYGLIEDPRSSVVGNDGLDRLAIDLQFLAVGGNYALDPVAPQLIRARQVAKADKRRVYFDQFLKIGGVVEPGRSVAEGRIERGQELRMTVREFPPH